MRLQELSNKYMKYMKYINGEMGHTPARLMSGRQDSTEGRNKKPDNGQNKAHQNDKVHSPAKVTLFDRREISEKDSKYLIEKFGADRVVTATRR